MKEYLRSCANTWEVATFAKVPTPMGAAPLRVKKSPRPSRGEGVSQRGVGRSDSDLLLRPARPAEAIANRHWLVARATLMHGNPDARRSNPDARRGCRLGLRLVVDGLLEVPHRISDGF